MTREEQIKIAAQETYRELYENFPFNDSDAEESFVEGAKWADEHPNWTLCKDKLPPKSDKCVSLSKSVYLAIEHKNSYGTKILYAQGGYSFIKEKWFSEDWNLNDESMKVVAWLPLPKFNPDNYKEI